MTIDVLDIMDEHTISKTMGSLIHVFRCTVCGDTCYKVALGHALTVSIMVRTGLY